MTRSKKTKKQKIFKAVKNSFAIYMCIGCVLAVLTGFICFKGIKEFFANRTQIVSVAIVNRTTSTVSLYWKSPEEIDSQHVSYKEEYVLGTYKRVEDIIEVGTDNASGEHIYYVMIR